MKTIGLLGGMSWESTVTYYQAVNQGIKEQLGGLHSAKVAMVSVDFEPIEQLMHQDDWDATAKILVDAARQIEAAGADFFLICTNTMHKLASQVQAAVSIPLLHIADATARVLTSDGIRTVGLLGTEFTMAQDFYKGRLKETHGLDVLVPAPTDRKIVHDVIFQELCQGRIEAGSKKEYLRIIEDLADNGAEAVILGCTEIGLLVNQNDTPIRLLDTTAIHARAAVAAAVGE